ncbi:cobalt ABC transporter permease [Catellatospora sp. IY07-71]|uniref:energy-coupling factor transporter transmembrane component T family protein n=1 Tax=Catellatospora sp. IY07-71 TaxID=2728827 RepID=UPI001BB6E378|nr:energy-coupling factor transporter transmembrane component T [Catellatospora sp. IY07-71]BCJ70472.1 cobalt ABC transporter permease [Catellatospora sp. IY07-71]
MTGPIAVSASSAPPSTALLARRTPVAKIVALALFTTAALLTRDVAALGFALAATFLVAPLFGITPWGLLRRGWPALLGAASVVVSLALFAADRSGTVLFAAGPIVITTTVLVNALSLAMRLLAIALPSVLVFSTTDPTDLADSLIQHARVSARFAIGALAAFRLVGLLGDEWRMIAMARRARGIDAGRNPARWLRLFASTAFGLLVGAIRRGTRLAVAMDARGFDAGLPRTVARPMPWRPADWLLIAAGATLATAIQLIAHR